MEATAYEIKKLNEHVYTANYEDFVKHPKEFIANMTNYLGLKPSKYIDNFMNKLSVQNRNNRAAASAKTTISEETKIKIMQIVNS